jgi:hypothetical protein
MAVEHWVDGEGTEVRPGEQGGHRGWWTGGGTTAGGALIAV